MLVLLYTVCMYSQRTDCRAATVLALIINHLLEMASLSLAWNRAVIGIAGLSRLENLGFQLEVVQNCQHYRMLFLCDPIPKE